MTLSSVVAIFCVLGKYLHIASSPLQYQIVWITPAVFMFLCIVASFFVCETPRWLLIVQRREDAVTTLHRLRRLPTDDARVLEELNGVEKALEQAGMRSGGTLTLLKEIFTAIQPAPAAAEPCIVCFGATLRCQQQYVLFCAHHENSRRRR